MKLCHDERVAGSPPSLDDTAQLAIETGSRLMRVVRRAVRASSPTTISISGLKTLGFLLDSPGACLSDVADHLFVGVPTASKLVDDLAERGYLARAADSNDRRKLTLTLTADGKEFITTAARPAQERIAEMLARLPEKDRARVREGLVVLRAMLESADAADGGSCA